jgi:WD40 repeat protein
MARRWYPVASTGSASWDAKTGNLILKFDLPHSKNEKVEPDEDVVAIDLVPHTDLLVGAGRNALHFWNVKSGRYEKSFWCDDDHNIGAIAVSQDGRYLVSGGYDHTVRVWDIKTGKLHCTLFGHDGGVNGLAFAGDSKILASGSEDTTIKIWDVEEGRELQTLTGHTKFVRGICFSRDGRLLLSGSGDETIRFWNFGRVADYDRFSERLPQAQKILRTNPDDPTATALLGEWYYFRGIYDWAIRDLVQAKKAGAHVSSLDVVRCYWKIGELDLAAAELEPILNSTSDPEEALYLRLLLAALKSKEN